MYRSIDYIYDTDQTVVSKCEGGKCMDGNYFGESYRNIQRGKVLASGLKWKFIWI